MLTLRRQVASHPSTTYDPTNDYSDNRTSYVSTQAMLSIQKSTRVSYSIGGDAFATKRRSRHCTEWWAEAAVEKGTVPALALVDHRCRLQLHSLLLFTYLQRYGPAYPRRHLCDPPEPGHRIFGHAGATRYETKFIQSVPVDPAIAALIGVANLNQISYSKNWLASGIGRLSYTMKRGVASVSGGRAVTPGNGLFLTSTTTTVHGSYAYTALKRWSASANGGYEPLAVSGEYPGRLRQLRCQPECEPPSGSLHPCRAVISSAEVPEQRHQRLQHLVLRSETGAGVLARRSTAASLVAPPEVESGKGDCHGRDQ